MSADATGTWADFEEQVDRESLGSLAKGDLPSGEELRASASAAGILRTQSLVDNVEQPSDASTVANDEWAAKLQLTLGKLTPETLADSAAKMRALSGSTPLMTRPAMGHDYSMLMRGVDRGKEAKPIDWDASIKEWADMKKVNLTPHLHRALSEVCKNYSGIDGEALSWITLGWDMRGEHNTNEIKNVMDSHRDILVKINASYDKFEVQSKSILDGFRVAFEQMVSLERPKQPEVLPVINPLTGQALLSSSMKAAVAQPLKVNIPQEQSTSQTVAPKASGIKIDPNIPKTPAGLVKYLKISPEHFKELCPPEMFLEQVGAFMIGMSDKVWYQITLGANLDAIRAKLAQFLADQGRKGLLIKGGQ
ncbi:TPA_asm: protein 2 [Apera virus 1]|uniref:Protein 2 n=1 Tax=Apera virus 1 TaxID=2977951 RepID=A0A9N6YJ98_9RHAB|nr:TPA_asm: protein 2 [Apera virus 1]